MIDIDTFDQVYEMVERSSHETAFNRQEALALFHIASQLPAGSLIVEIGVQYGRSATVLGYCAKECRFKFFAIDNWKEGVSAEAKANVENVLIKEMGLPIHLIVADSSKAWKQLPPKKIDLIHIDGDHSLEGVYSDCATYLPMVKVGGYAFFDDYGHPGMPEVKKAVEMYMKDNSEWWDFVGQYGDKLGVYRRK